MAGFSGIISKQKLKASLSFRSDVMNVAENNFVNREISHENYIFDHHSNQKFLREKILNEDNEVIIGTDGVILNLTSLKTKYHCEDVFVLIKTMYIKGGKDFVKELKGDFSGFIFQKNDRSCFVYCNPTGSKRIFHFQNDSYFIFSSDLKSISHIKDQLKLPNKLDEQSAYLLLTNGFMLEDFSLLKDVKRLMPGNYLYYDGSNRSIIEYFHLRNIVKTNDSRDEIIEKMDILFNKAVRLEFEKDFEYGYKHMATLSGGLDSRMTVLVAHELGYDEQLNFTFSQKGYLDEKIARRIARDYKHDFHFESLGTGDYLKAIDTSVALNDGLVLYSGSAHLLYALNRMNTDGYGLIHTGLVGDAVIGSFLSRPYAIKATPTDGMYSKTLAHRVTDLISKVIEHYPNEEIYKFYSRGFLGAMNGNYSIDLFSQGVSPFLDIDFLSYCISIPDEMKYKQEIYIDWIARKHRRFADYPWEKTGVSPLKSYNYKKYLDPGYYLRMKGKFFDRLSGKMKSGMNPMDYWLEQNESLRAYLDTYFDEHIASISWNTTLQNDCQKLYKEGNSGEKFQVLTLLSAIKLHNITS